MNGGYTPTVEYDPEADALYVVLLNDVSVAKTFEIDAGTLVT